MSVVAIDAASDGERDWCAQLMASSDPWITLGRSYDDCLQRVTHPEYALLVAHVGDARAGFVLLHPRGFAGSPYVAAIAVAPEFRGNGIGGALLARSEIEFAGARNLFLLVSSFNARARALYERSGYVCVGEIPGYVIPSASEIILRKRLS